MYTLIFGCKDNAIKKITYYTLLHKQYLFLYFIYYKTNNSQSTYEVFKKKTIVL